MTEATPVALGRPAVMLEETLHDSGQPFVRRTFDVPDESIPAEREQFRAAGDAWEAELIAHPEWIAPNAENPSSNPAADWLYGGDATMQEWYRLFPTSLALYPLQRLDDFERVLTPGASHEHATNLFTNMVDGIGLRARARIMAELLLATVAASDGADFAAISLGCGAAVPDLDASTRAAESLDRRVNWNVYDIDARALALAEVLAAEVGLQSQLTTHVGSFVRAFGLPAGSVDFVDVLGLWEYLGDDTCARLLRRSMRLLAPGGMFVASNMLLDRPQLEFNRRAVGWPSVIQRSEAQLLRIAQAAGIGAAEVSMNYSADHVYVVMTITKPTE